MKSLQEQFFGLNGMGRLFISTIVQKLYRRMQTSFNALYAILSSYSRDNEQSQQSIAAKLLRNGVKKKT
jgi:hypothetical protein